MHNMLIAWTASAGRSYFPSYRYLQTVTLIALGLLGVGCQKQSWIEGRWLHVDETGKPEMCYEFASERKLSAYRSPSCAGQPDSTMSGKWQLKDDRHLAVLREADGRVLAVPLGEHDATQFVAQGGLAGTFHRIVQGQEKALIDTLRQAHVIKVSALNEADGCTQLGRSVAHIAALPKETAPRMLRERDQGLAYHSDRSAGPQVQKVVYALNQEQLDWVAFHLKPTAFEGSGPEAWLKQQLGPPLSTLTTGSAQTSQSIALWRAYCPNLRGVFNKDIDVTLFASPGKRDGVYYVSDGVIANLWEELKQTVEHAPTEATSTDSESGAVGGDSASPSQDMKGSSPKGQKETPH